MSIILAITAWFLVLLGIFSIIHTTYKGIATVRRLHRIPCANCQYFTQNYMLKCTVNPHIALTKLAINCLDFDP